MRPGTLATVDPGAGFLLTLARHWLDMCGGDPLRSGDGLIILPTRRAARALADAFLAVSNRPALLLPRIEAIGAVDEAPLAVGGVLDLPPAIGPLHRQALLARLILAREQAPPAIGAAFELAASLADLIDEAAHAGIDLARGLPTLAPGALALHWQTTLDFLSIVTEGWPRALDAAGLADPAARQVRLLEAQAAAWQATRPERPVWLAGVLAATPSEAALARAVAALPRGRVILPALDLDLDEASWRELGETHPQAGLQRLLAALGATRDDVVRLAHDCTQGIIPAGRAALLRRALLPELAIASWRDTAPSDLTRLELIGLSVIAAADEQSEALAISLALRAALETPGRTAALVTPDRRLARRVAAELGRFGVIADDSAGEPLAETPPGSFLRLLAAAVADALPPATLLALLKHPFAAIGLSAAACRAETRRLERLCLRGPRPRPGIDGLRQALAAARAGAAERAHVASFLARLEHALAPLLGPAVSVPPQRLIEALLETAENLADPAQLWSGEEGEAAAAHIADLADALAALPDQPPASLPGLLDASFAGVSVRGRRALRGRDDPGLHPRISIWGLLEARGQSADLLVLGGLTEGTWPAATDPGPWMGRPMRAEIGLPPPERAIGIAAHDFATLACTAPEVILSWSKRRERAPAVPSRWIARLEALTRGTLPAHPALAWAAALDAPEGPPRPALPPEPRPPLHARPRRLSITEIETWLRNPYAIYARHVLGLRPLAPIEENADRALFGNLVHEALSEAFRNGDTGTASLNRHFEAALDRHAVRPGVAAWWRPRLARIAEWVAAEQASRSPALLVGTEVEGRETLDLPGGPFTLTGRADRIERHADGVSILDYKTGSVPSKTDIRQGWSPQLPLEAALATRGAFGEAFRDLPVTELAHWKLSGGATPGEASTLGGDKLAAAIDENWQGLLDYIGAFDDPTTAYRARPYPTFAPRYDRFETLARVAEWSAQD